MIWPLTMVLMLGQLQGLPAVSPSVRLVLREVTARPIRLAVTFINDGGGDVWLDPVALHTTLLGIRFSDGAGRRISYVGDEIAAYVPLTPERAVKLGKGDFIGFEQTYKLRGTSRARTVTARFDYQNFGKKTNHSPVWEGTLFSNVLKIDDQGNHDERSR